jgi:hypothetical protein
MADFRILQTLSHGANVIFDRAANVGMTAGVERLEVATTRGLVTPGNQILPMFGVALPNLEITTRHELGGAGTGALHDAISSLVNLGTRHGVDGISLGSDPASIGLIKLKSSIGYEGGGRILAHLGSGDVEAGRAVAQRIDVAARRVMEFAS